jgi:hypothetical protein
MKLVMTCLLVVGFTAIGLGQPEATHSPAPNGEEEAVHKVVDEIVAAIDRNDADAFVGS